MSKMIKHLAWLAIRIQPRINEVATAFSIQKPAGEDIAVAEVLAGLLLGQADFNASKAIQLAEIVGVDAREIMSAYTEVQLEKLNYTSPEATAPEKRVKEPRQGCSGGRSSVRDDMLRA